MSTIGNNPIIEIEEFINRHYNFIRYIKSGLLLNYINSENECNLYMEKSSKLYLLRSSAKANEIDNSINILKGIYINGDSRQLEAFKKVISSDLTGLYESRKEYNLLNIELNKRGYKYSLQSLKHYLSDWLYFDKKYQKYFEHENQSSEQRELKYPNTDIKIPFDANLFKDEYSTNLFCYLIEHYHNGKDKELSNIYQWMENNNFIHLNKRKEYKDLVKKHEITTQKYNRVHASTEYKPNELDPTFNDLKKRFDKDIKQ